MRRDDPEIWRDQRAMFPPMAIGLSMGGFYVTAAGSLIATLSRDLGEDLQTFSWFGSAYGFGMLVCGLIAPWFMRFGPVWSLRLAPFFVFVGTGLLAWSPRVSVALVGATVACFGATLVSAAVAGTFVGYGGTRYLSLTVGISSTVSIATTVVFALVERLFPGNGRMAIWFVVVVAFPTLILGWRLPAVPFLQFLKGRPILVAVAEPQFPPDSCAKAASLKFSHGLLMWQILRLILVAGVEFAVYAWAVTRFQQLGVELATASGLATAFAIGMAVGRICAAGLTRKRFSWISFVALGALGTALAAYIPSIPVAVAGFALAGIGVSCLYPISASDFSSLPGIYPHRAAAVISTLSGVGALVTPVLLGVLLGAVGLQAGFGILLGFYVLLAIIPRP